MSKKINGLYIRLSTKALSDAKLLSVGLDGLGLWVRGLLYAKEQSTDGHIPEAALPMLTAGTEDAESIVHRLLAAGLWDRSESGYGVSPERWARYQTTNAEIEARRQQWRKSKARQRKCPHDVHVDSRESPANVRPLKEEEKEKGEIKERAPTADAVADPLDEFPHLLEAMDELEALLLEVHPKAKRPKAKTKEWAAERQALAQLVELDGHEVEAVIATLRWLFKSNDSDAAFWRKQVHAWKPLRKTKDGASKFTKINEAMINSKGDTHVKPYRGYEPEPDPRNPFI